MTIESLLHPALALCSLVWTDGDGKRCIFKSHDCATKISVM